MNMHQLILSALLVGMKGPTKSIFILFCL